MLIRAGKFPHVKPLAEVEEAEVREFSGFLESLMRLAVSVDKERP